MAGSSPETVVQDTSLLWTEALLAEEIPHAFHFGRFVSLMLLRQQWVIVTTITFSFLLHLEHFLRFFQEHPWHHHHPWRKEEIPPKSKHHLLRLLCLQRLEQRTQVFLPWHHHHPNPQIPVVSHQHQIYLLSIRRRRRRSSKHSSIESGFRL